MNRKTKIAVSVAGIFIVTLALIGLTFGYYLTRINGNTNPKSISASTQKLELTYSDNSSEIIGDGKELVPSNEPIGSKTFTVTNNGGDTNYSVVLEDMSIKDATTNEETTFESNDFRYTLTCTTKSGSSCNEISEQTELPLISVALLNNDIAKGDIHTYTLTIWYLETGVDQSNDMGKSISAKLNIIDPVRENPYKNNKNTLAYNIINNAILQKNGTSLVNKTKTVPAQEITSWEYERKNGIEALRNSNITVSTTYQGYYWTYATDYEVDKTTGKFSLVDPKVCKYSDSNCISDLVTEGNTIYLASNSLSKISNSTNKINVTYNLDNVCKVTEAPTATTTTITLRCKYVTKKMHSTEKELSIAPDDYGISYYYRGGVTDNYLELNNMCWRIIRVQGDGSIKIILANEGPCSESSINSGLINNAETNIVYGYDYTNSNYYFNYEGYTGTNGLHKVLNDWFDSNFKENGELTNIGKKLKNETWCLGEKISRYNYATGVLMSDADVANQLENKGFNSYYYETGLRLLGLYDELNRKYDLGSTRATYKCSSEADKVTGYIGTILADEVAYAGSVPENVNKAYYLYDNAQKSYWTLSRSDLDNNSDCSFRVNEDGSQFDYRISSSGAVRPVVTIATSAEIASGDGTIERPYIIK